MKRILYGLLATMLLFVQLFALPAYAETILKDGIEVQLITDKESYQLLEAADARLLVTNTNNFAIENVRMSIQAPEGYVLLEEANRAQKAVKLDAGDSKEQQSSVINSEVASLPRTGDDSHGMVWFALFFASSAALLVLVVKHSQGKRLLSLLLCVALLSSLIPAPGVAKAESVEKTITVTKEVLVNGEVVVLTGVVTYDAFVEASDPSLGAPTIADEKINNLTEQLQVETGDTLSFTGMISAPEGAMISSVQVFIYDAMTEEPYTTGEKYYAVYDLNTQEFDLSGIPQMTIGTPFGESNYALEEGGLYCVMFYATDSNGNCFEDMDEAIEGDQGPVIRISVKADPEDCEHPHAGYSYVRHSSGKIRKHSYDNPQTHQVEPLYERYCGLCGLYLMDIWGQGTTEDHIFVNGVCSGCGYNAGDVTPPVIEPIRCSVEEAFTAGTEITFNTAALDDVALAKIELYIDDELKHTETPTEEFGTISFTTSSLSVGSHTVKVVAIDESGWSREVNASVMVLQADPATCTHVNTAVVQDQKYTSVDDAYHQLVLESRMHCADCDTDISISAEPMAEPIEHDAWNEGVCETCGHSLVAAMFGEIIAVEMISEQVLINADVQFKVMIDGADSCMITFYDAEGNVDYTEDILLEDGVGTFSGWAGIPCTEKMMISCWIGGAEYSVEKTVEYLQIGEIASAPTLNLTQEPVVGQDYAIAWEAVPGVEWYNLYFTNPAGSKWYYGGAANNCTVPAEYIYATGEYGVSLEATCAGYASTYAETSVTVSQSIYDSSIVISTDKSEILYNQTITLSISAPGAEAIRLYDGGELLDEYEGDSIEDEWWPGAGEHAYYASAKYNGVWSSFSETVSVKVTSYGKAVVTITGPNSINLGDDLTATITMDSYTQECYIGIEQKVGTDWLEVGYEFLSSNGNITIDKSEFEGGSYRLAVWPYTQDGWEDDTVYHYFSVMGNRTEGPSVTADKTHVYVMEDVTFTVNTTGATHMQWRAVRDGSLYMSGAEHPVNGETATYTFGQFDEADDYEVSFRLKINGEWTAYGKPVTITVMSHGTIAPSVITAPDSIKLGDDFVFSFTEVEHAVSYSVYLYRDEGNTLEFVNSEYSDTAGEMVFTADNFDGGEYKITIDPEMEAGWEAERTRHSFTVEGQRAEGPEIMLEKDQVYVNEEFYVNIDTTGATKYDGEYDGDRSTHSTSGLANGNSTRDSVSLSRAGTYDVAYRILVGGEWTAFGESKQLTVITKGTLTAPEITMVSQSMAGEDVIVSWKSLENAGEYQIYLYGVDEYGEEDYVNSWYITAPAVQGTIDGSRLTAGEYIVRVVASGVGYEQVESEEVHLTVSEGDRLFTYTVDNEDITITGYVGSDTEVVIPDEIDGSPVTVIGNNAFSGRDVTSVKLPSTLTAIEYSAFRYCEALTELHIERNVDVDQSAFYGCSNLTVYGYTGSSAEAAAEYCGCEFVSEGTLDPAPVVSASATEITTDSSVAFTVTVDGATKLRVMKNDYIWEEVYAAGTNTVYSMQFTSNGTVSVSFSALVAGNWTAYSEPIVITVKNMGELAVSTVTIPENLRAGEAFAISWTVVENAERYYLNINDENGRYVMGQTVNAPATRVEFEEGALIEGSYELTLQADAEGWESSETNVEFEVGAPEEGKEYTYTLDSDGNATLTKYLGADKDVTIPATIEGHSVEAVAGYAFRYNNIQSVTIANGVDINGQAFYGCGALTDIYMPKELGWISPYAFEDAEAATWHVYANSQMHVYAAANGYKYVLYDEGAEDTSGISFIIAEGPYYYGEYITFTLSLPEGTTEVKAIVDGEDYSTKNVSLTEGAEYNLYFYPRATKTYYIQFSAYANDEWTAPCAFKTIEVIYNGKLPTPVLSVPENVTAMQPLTVTWQEIEGAEEYWISLYYLNGQERIRLASDISTKATYTFEASDVSRTGELAVEVSANGTGYTNSETATALLNATAQGDWAYSANSSGVTITGYLGSETEVIVPAEIDGKTVVRIDNAFEGSNVTSVTLNEGVKYIYSAFGNCPALEKVVLPSSVSYMSYAFSGSDKVTAYVYEGTYAHDYVVANSIPYIVMANPTQVPAFTVTPTEILIEEGVEINITNTTAEGIRVYVDDSSYTTAAVTDGKCSIKLEHNFYNEGTYAIQIRGCENGIWSAISEAVYVTARCIGTLDAPVITVPDTVVPKDTFRIIWTPVEHATDYRIELEDAAGNSFAWLYWYDGDTVDENGQCYVECDKITNEGVYVINVEARAVGYIDTEASVSLKAEAEFPYLYTVSDAGVTITGYVGDETEVDVPDTIENLPVITIGESAFAGNEKLISVSLPETVTTIEKSAFSRCRGLTALNLPDALTGIGDYAFYYCGDLTDISIPAGVTYVGESAFSSCESIESIALPEGLDTIADSVFSGCSKLESIVIPDSVKSIEERAFQNCWALMAVSIPDSVTSIGPLAFCSCENLQSVMLGDGLETIEHMAFYECKALQGIEIPDSVTSIGSSAFAYCSNLKDVELPSALEQYRFDAFEYCDALESIMIPSGVTRVGAFDACLALTELTIPEGVTTISDITNCPALNKVTIPRDVTSIVDGTFDGCDSLTIYGYSNSTAHTYATANDIPFVAIGEVPMPTVTLDKTSIFFDEEVNITISAPKAESIRLYIDGYLKSEYELVDGTVTVTESFDKENRTYSISASASKDGYWSGICEAQELEVIYYGKLDTPVIEEIGTVDSNSQNEFRFNWSAPANAQTYDVLIVSNAHVINVFDQIAFNGLTENELEIIPLDQFNKCSTGAILCVTAHADGFESSERAEMIFSIRQITLDAPVVELPESVVYRDKLNISWDDVRYADAYVVQVRDSEGNSIFLDTNWTETEVSVDTIPAKADGMMSVDVHAIAEDYEPGEFSGETELVVYGTLENPVLTLPEMAYVHAGNHVEWETVGHAESYQIVVQSEYDNYTMTTEDAQYDFNLNEGYKAGDTVNVRVEAIARGYFTGSSSAILPVEYAFDYEIVDQKVIITGYNAEAADVLVPDTIEGYPVTQIGAGAFEGSKIVSILLPNTITILNDRAFKNSTSLEKVVGKGVNVLGDEVFSGCSSLVLLELADEIVEIGESAFVGSGTTVIIVGGSFDITIVQNPSEEAYADNPILSSASYKEGVTVIPRRTHYNNAKLANVYLPTTLKTIEAQAFAQCGVLSYVKIYDGVEEIADNAFEDSENTAFEIYVKDLDTVSYVEQYAIDHEIPYNKVLYSAGEPDEPVEPEIEIEGDAFVGVVETPTGLLYTVLVDRLAVFKASGEAADKVIVYLDNEEVDEVGFADGYAQIPYTFTELGEHHFYAESYIDGTVSERTLDKTLNVVGTTFNADKTEAWTCENVHFEIASTDLTGVVYLYADGDLFAQAELVDGKASIDYAFTKAGDRKITAKTEGYTSVEKIVTVNASEKLAQPVVTAQEIQLYAAGLEISWGAVEHAEGYVVHALNELGEIIYRQDVKKTDETQMTHTIAAQDLPGIGNYAVYVMAYGYRYDQSQSDSVTVTLIDSDEIIFTMNLTSVMTGEAVTFTVVAADAVEAKLIVDGDEIETHSMTDYRVTFTRPFHKSGEREVTFSVLRDGEWSDPADVQMLTVTSAGQLDAPVVTAAAKHVLDNDVPVSWNAVKHADGYSVYVTNSDGTEVFRKENITDTALTIPSQAFVSCTLYTITVMAYGTGYDQSKGTAQTQIIDRLPGPVITSPTEGQSLSAHEHLLTWEAVEGAQSYVVSLAKKTMDASGNAVYEKVWASPNEVVNVGDALEYPLTDLVFGTEYRVAVGAVLEGTGLEDAAKVGWTEREFSVAVPALNVTVSAEPNPAYEKQMVTITATVDQAQSTAVLKDANGNVHMPAANKSEEGKFVFEVTEEKQGEYVYTVTVSGTGELANAALVEKTITVTYLDANAPKVETVTVKPTTIWPGTEITFEIVANPNTEFIDVYLHNEDGSETYDGPYAYEDALYPSGNRVFTYKHSYDEAGTYTLHFTPVNADKEWSAGYPVTITVLEKGKLPNPELTNLANGDVLINDGFVVEWEPLDLAKDMEFGGYCLLLEKKNADGSYALVPSYVYAHTDSTSYPLTGLEAGSEYRLHLYTLEKGHAEPDGKLHGETIVDFGYRTIPDFAVTSIETNGLILQPVTVKWNPPVWKDAPDLKPDRYVIWWYGPGLDGGYAMEASGDASSCVLPKEKLTQGGSFSVNVYAIMGENQRMSGGIDSFQIVPPTVTVDSADVKDFQIAEHDVHVKGSALGGVQTVSVELLENDVPVTLVDANEKLVSRLVLEVTNQAFSCELEPYYVNPPARYSVRVRGYMNMASAQAGTDYKCETVYALTMLNGEITSILLNQAEAISKMRYAFTGDTLYEVYVQGFAESVAVTIDGRTYTFDSDDRTPQGNGNYRFDAKLSLDEGIHTISFKTGSGTQKKTTQVASVKRMADTIVYAGVNGANLKAWPTDGYAVAKVLQANQEIKLRGMCGEYAYVQVNGVNYFVHEDDLIASLDEDQQSGSWTFKIIDNGAGMYVYSAKVPANNYKYKLVMAEGFPNANLSTIREFTDEEDLFVYNAGTQNFNQKFSFIDDLRLSSGKTYHFAVVPVDTNLSSILAFMKVFTYVPEGKILMPADGEYVNIWSDESFEIVWGLYSDAVSYKLEVILTIETESDLATDSTGLTTTENTQIKVVEIVSKTLTPTTEEIERGSMKYPVYAETIEALVEKQHFAKALPITIRVTAIGD